MSADRSELTCTGTKKYKRRVPSLLDRYLPSSLAFPAAVPSHLLDFRVESKRTRLHGVFSSCFLS